jgi:hypothetical protein
MMIRLLCACTCAVLAVADDDAVAAANAAQSEFSGLTSRARDATDESKLLKAKLLDGTVAKKGTPTYSGPDFWNVAHMTLTKKLIDWAEDRGANAVEIDVIFDHDVAENAGAKGAWPAVTYHGSPCDCTCVYLASVPLGLCSMAPFGGQFWATCQTEGLLHDVLIHIAKNYNLDKAGLGLVHFDNKIANAFAGPRAIYKITFDAGVYGGWRGYVNNENQEQTGRNLGIVIWYYLFRQGFTGIAVVGGSANTKKPQDGSFFIGVIALMAQVDYLASTWIAWEADQDGGIEGLSLSTFINANSRLLTHMRGNGKLKSGESYTRVMCNGISSCIHTSKTSKYYARIKGALVSKHADKVFTWTVDDWWAMESYLSFGTDGLITNNPAILSLETKKYGRPMPNTAYK